MKATIYHNPRCSKSRQTLALLEENKLDIIIVEYLKTPLSRSELDQLHKQLQIEASQMIRTKEAEFKTAAINLSDDDAVLDAIEQLPKLLERPIVVTEKGAVTGRPPENVLEII